jgi:hypothetical protein
MARGLPLQWLSSQELLLSRRATFLALWQTLRSAFLLLALRFRAFVETAAEASFELRVLFRAFQRGVHFLRIALGRGEKKSDCQGLSCAL